MAEYFFRVEDKTDIAGVTSDLACMLANISKRKKISHIDIRLTGVLSLSDVKSFMNTIEAYVDDDSADIRLNAINNPDDMMLYLYLEATIEVE